MAILLEFNVLVTCIAQEQLTTSQRRLSALGKPAHNQNKTVSGAWWLMHRKAEEKVPHAY